MKKLSLFVLLTALCFSLFSSCASPAPKEETDTAAEARLSQLEEQIRALRELHDADHAKNQTRLEDLATQLGQLEQDTHSPVTSSPAHFLYRTENGNAIITGFTEDVTSLVIPAAIDGYPVIAVGEGAFRSSSLQSVIVSAGITRLDWFAFYQCASLTQITLPNSVTSIGHSVFDGCSPSLSIYCAEASFAHTYCKSYGIRYTLI